MALASSPAVAQQLSEQALRKFMDFAWALTPNKFTKPGGQTILIDKSKKAEVLIPLDAAREVVRVGRLSAHAQICELLDDQVANYRSLMLREEQSKKWTDQQLIYINQLHLTTVTLLTGKLKLVERDGDKQVVVEDLSAKSKAQTCSEEQRAQVRELIVAYVKKGPSLASNAAGKSPPATGSLPNPQAASSKQ